ncbi:hypothetical protein LCGC14_2113650, partial [marine sediment metagenome]
PRYSGTADGIDFYLLRNSSAGLMDYGVVEEGGVRDVSMVVAIAPGDELYMAVGARVDDITDGTLVGLTFRVVYPDTPPVADTNGPYTVYPGDPLILDASDSTDVNDDIVSYEWDLNDDGVFETDASGNAFFSVPYASLTALGLSVGHMDDIRLLVTDSVGFQDTDSGTLRIVPEPTTLALLLGAGAALLTRRKRRG